MRFVSAVLVAAVLAAGAACSTGDTPPTVVAASTSALVIRVDGMACEKCASRVHRTLVALDGVADADVHLDEKRVIVHYDAHKLSPDRLVSAIDGAGFEAGKPEVPR